VSPVLAEQYMSAAGDGATAALNGRWAALVPWRRQHDGRRAGRVRRDFIASSDRRPYRRPLDADDSAVLTGCSTPARQPISRPASGWSSRPRLQSPRFLYRVEFARWPRRANRGSSRRLEMASPFRILLWHSNAHDALFTRRSGQLSSSDQIQTRCSA